MSLKKTFSRVAATCFTLGILGAICVSTSFGQATGTIRGSISDSSGASMPGVTVTVGNPQLGVDRSVVTNQSGAFVISTLQPGSYDINVEHAGFKKTVKHASVD